jgi:hypothetical protein
MAAILPSDSKTTFRHVGEPTKIAGRSMSTRKIATLILLLGVWILASINATLVAVRPAMPPRRDSPQAEASGPGQRLTGHVLLVIVDGLRWDVANDSATMPQFAEALRGRASGEVWAGRITMTSSALLAYGTGQRGDLDQILENLHPPRTGVNDWLHNAKRAGLRLMGAGDAAWSQLYGDAFESFRPDPQGVMTETDFNAQTFRDARELQKRSPDFLVAHFVTPDHQGHAWGIKSARYAGHMRHFDRTLFEWLASFGPNWTVIATSDHGAADSGTHGTDTIEQRRCPLFAYGPGIRPTFHPSRALDQVELPGLLSALLGVPTAEQARGRVPFEWLELSPEAERRLACSEIRRLAVRVPRTSRQEASDATRDCCDNVGDNNRCIEQTRQLAHNYDNAQGQVQGTHARHGWYWLAIAGLAALAAAVVIYGWRALRVAAIGTVWLGIALTLTYSVERLAGNWPNLIRALLFVIANACLVAAVIRFKSWASRFERHWALTLGVLPGWLLVSYTTNTQVEAYACIVALGVFLWFRARVGGARKATEQSVASGVVLLAIFALLALAGTHPSDVCPKLFTEAPTKAAVTAAVLLAAGVAGLFYAMRRPIVHGGLLVEFGPQRHKENRQLRGEVVWMAVGVFAALLSFVLRHYAISWAGRVAWVACALGAMLAHVADRRRLALVFAVTGYVWLSRDFEILVFVPALVAADIVGRACAANKSNPLRVVSVTFLFALSYVQWIGLQGGLQLNTMDFAAGTFGDAGVRLWLTGAALTAKFLLAQTILIGVFARWAANDERGALLRGLGAMHLARGTSLLAMLYTCGHSYWTAFRVVADLPFAVVGMLAVAAVWPGSTSRASPGSPAAAGP